MANHDLTGRTFKTILITTDAWVTVIVPERSIGIVHHGLKSAVANDANTDAYAGVMVEEAAEDYQGPDAFGVGNVLPVRQGAAVTFPGSEINPDNSEGGAGKRIIRLKAYREDGLVTVMNGSYDPK